MLTRYILYFIFALVSLSSLPKFRAALIY